MNECSAEGSHKGIAGVLGSHNSCDFSCYLCSFSVESISQDETEIQANAPRMWRRFVSVTVCYAADSTVQL